MCSLLERWLHLLQSEQAYSSLQQGLVVTTWIKQNTTVEMSHKICVKLPLKYSLFWDVTQSEFVIRYRRFGTIHWSHFQWSGNPVGVEDGTFFKAPETNYQSVPRSIPDERRSHLHDGGRLKLCTEVRSSTLALSTLSFWRSCVSFNVSRKVSNWVWRQSVCARYGNGGKAPLIRNLGIR